MHQPIRQHRNAPEIVSGYPLNPQREWLDIVVPEGTTNLFRNPSFETNTGNWTASGDGAGATLARTTDAQFRGAYAASLTIGAGGSYAQIVGPSISIGVTYAISFHVRRPGGGPVTLADVRAVFNNTTQAFQRIAYVADGWWRVWAVLTATATNAPGIRVLGAAGDVWHLDACQLEANDHVTTYCDGDQAGSAPGEQPPAFRWNGTAHASTSTRSATTGAGGRVVNLADFGATILAIQGLGAAAVNNVITPLGLIDGGLYQRSIRPERSFTITVQFEAGRDPTLLSKRRGALRSILAHDRVGDPQPVRIAMQRYDGAQAVGDRIELDVLYGGGLEESADNLYAERAAIQFIQPRPLLRGAADAGVTLDTREDVSIAYLAVRDRETGAWAGLGSLNAVPLALVFGPDRKLYAGGTFTAPGTRVAAYNFDTAAWETLDSGLGQQVNALCFGPDGTLYAGLNAAVTIGPTTGSVVAWDGAAWAVTATGNSDVVQALAYDTRRDRLYATGATGGNTTLRYLSAGSWTTVTSGTGGSTGYALAYDPRRDRLYLGGGFTNLTGVAEYDAIVQYNGTAFAQLAGGANAAVRSLSLDPDGNLYAAGNFTSVGGLTATGFAVWNGQGWDVLDGLTNSGLAGQPRVAYDPVLREVWASGGEIGLVPGSFIPVAVWRADDLLTLPGALFVVDTNNVPAIAFGEDVVAVAYNVSGTLPAAGATTITNAGTLPSPVRLVFDGVTRANTVVYQIINYTTGKQIGFSLTMFPGEVVTLDLAPAQARITSSVRGDLSDAILPSSDFDFAIVPGENVIYAFTTDPDTFPITVALAYAPRYLSFDDATLAPPVLP